MSSETPKWRRVVDQLLRRSDVRARLLGPESLRGIGRTIARRVAAPQPLDQRVFGQLAQHLAARLALGDVPLDARLVRRIQPPVTERGEFFQLRPHVLTDHRG